MDKAALAQKIETLDKNNEKLIRKLNREKKARRIILLVLLLILAFFFLVWIIAAFRDFTGGFTINLNYKDAEGFSLFDNRAFMDPKAKLEADPLRSMMTNITLSDLNLEVIDNEDGSHHGQANSFESSYFAYTFYLRNSTMHEHEYEGRINLIDAAKNADAAVRIILIEDTLTYGAPGNERRVVVYGKAKADGEKDVFCDESFLNERGEIVYFKKTLRPEASHKYTLILYLEGEDAECVDDIKGGMTKLAMDFLVL